MAEARGISLQSPPAAAASMLHLRFRPMPPSSREAVLAEDCFHVMGRELRDGCSERMLAVLDESAWCVEGQYFSSLRTEEAVFVEFVDADQNTCESVGVFEGVSVNGRSLLAGMRLVAQMNADDRWHSNRSKNDWPALMLCPADAQQKFSRAGAG